MIRKMLMLVGCGGAVALFACSTDSAGDKFPSSDSFCGAFADAQCSGIAAGCGVTVDICKQLATSTCKSDATAPGRVYNASKADDCITKTHDMFAQKTFTVDQQTAQQDSCARVYGGTVAKNGACTTDAQCGDTLVCSKGLCSDKTVKNQGDPCNNPGDVCAKGSYCGAQGAVNFCLPKKGQGDICRPADLPCLEDLRCVNTCGPKLALGNPCDTDDDCPSATAAPYCDPTQRKCFLKFSAGTKSCKDVGGP